MKKISKISLTMLVLTLSIFLVAGTGNANCIDDADGTSYGCGATIPAGHSCTFNADLVCAAPGHGLLIGGPGVTIDGAGYKLDGQGVAGRNCEVAQMTPGDPDQGWCLDHPCRCASNNPGGPLPTACDGCIDSGILNVLPANAAPGGNCQGGSNHVTVKSLVITGWCDGIFMSGTCGNNPPTTEVRLTGIVIEGNIIHDCGAGCGNYTQVACPNDGEEGYWDYPNYNDAIYLAQVGLDETNCDAWGPTEIPQVGQVGLPAETDYTNWCAQFNFWIKRCPAPCQCKPTSNPNCAFCTCWERVQKRALEEERGCFMNVVRDNIIYDQKGCAKISCPGGNGINLNGGIELFDDDDVFIGRWCGGNDIANNVIKHSAMSGIMYTHATKHNRIHGNKLVGNLFGGITDPCGWCDDNYIFDNQAVGNYGMGIAIAAKATIANNYCLDNMAVTDPNLQLLCYPFQGFGIYSEGSGSEIVGNICCGNAAADIMDGGAAVGDQNMCKRTNAFCDDDDPTNAIACETAFAGAAGPGGCRYVCDSRLNCKSDINHDCTVDSNDQAQFNSDWFWQTTLGNPDYCCPKAFPFHP